MLIDFDALMSKYGIPRGIIHIGAHELQERPSYEKHQLYNTIWIEANPNIVRKINSYTQLKPTESLFNFAAIDSNVDEIELNIASFDQSSSILQLGTHKLHYPQIGIVDTIKVPAKRMENFIELFGIPMKSYNFVNVDIQGAELSALKGFGKYLNFIDFIYTEVNKEELYLNCCLLDELTAFLEHNGFELAELTMDPANWGDALFIRKK